MKKELPKDLDRFNWGAFFTGWIWAIAMKNPLAFVLSFFLGFIGNIIIAIEGNKWAWQTREFDSLEEFIKVQEAWTKIGLVFFILYLIFSTILFIAMIVIMIIIFTNLESGDVLKFDYGNLLV